MCRHRAIRAAAMVLLSGTVLPFGLCFSLTGENGREFRQQAIPGLHSGVSGLIDGIAGGDAAGVAGGFNAILGGVIDGLFEILTPDGTSGSATAGP